MQILGKKKHQNFTMLNDKMVALLTIVRQLLQI